MSIHEIKQNDDDEHRPDESGNPYYDSDYKPSPEDFDVADVVKKKRIGPLRKLPPKKYAFSGIFFFCLFYLVSHFYWNGELEQYVWASQYTVFKRHEWWRLVTALFTHADMGHLAANGPLFVIFSFYLRSYFGRKVFPVLAFIIGIITNIITVLYYDPNTRLIGASGMVYGMVAMWLVFYVRFDFYHSVLKRLFRATGFSLVMLFPTTFSPSTSYMAHAVGFSLGLVLSIIFLPFVSTRSNQQEH